MMQFRVINGDTTKKEVSGRTMGIGLDGQREKRDGRQQENGTY